MENHTYHLVIKSVGMEKSLMSIMFYIMVLIVISPVDL